MASDLEQFLIERLTALDSTIDTASGSPAQYHVIEPLLARLETDPLGTNIRSFILGRLANEHPDLDITGAGSEIVDLLVNPMQTILEPFRRELARVKLSQSMDNPAALLDSELDAILANLFEDRQHGDFSSGVVRMYFSSPRTLDLDNFVYFLSSSALRFFVEIAETITSDVMALQVEDGLYYVDVDVEAEKEGSIYNIDSNAMASVFGVPGVVRVDNKVKFSGGIDRESNLQYINRAETAISQRSPDTESGITNKLTGLFDEIRAIKVIGYGDVEMERDIIKGTANVDAAELGLGPVIITGTDGDPVAHDMSTIAPSNTLLLTNPTNRYESAAADLQAVPAGLITVTSPTYPGDVLHADEADRGITKVVSADGAAGSADLIEVDDFSIVVPDGLIAASGGLTTGYLPGGDATKAAPLLFADRLTSSEGGLGGVKPGDRLFIETPPGNGTKTDWIVRTVNTGYVTVGDGTIGNEFLPNEIIAYGGTGSTLASGVQVSGGGLDTIDLDPASTTYDFDTTISGVSVQVNDWITVEDAIAGIHEERQITVQSSTQLTVSPGFTASVAQWDGKWTVRKNTASTNFLEAAPVTAAQHTSKDFAIIRHRADINPSTYSFLDSADSGQYFTVRTRKTLTDLSGSIDLTISDIPGAVTDPSTLEGPITIKNNEVHVGGMTDVYIYEAGEDGLDHLFSNTFDDVPLATGTDLTAVAASDVVAASALAGLAVDDTSVLVITDVDSDYAGSYRVVQKDTASGTMRIDTSLSNGIPSGVSYYITSLLKINLASPKVNKVTNGSGLKTIEQTKTVSDSSVASWLDLDIKADDTLEILTGTDKGSYVIESVSAGELILATPLVASASSLTYKIYTSLPPIDIPFRRLSKIEVLSASGGATGLTVPYGAPVDIRTTKLENAGRGAKSAAVDGVTTASSPHKLTSATSTFKSDGVAIGDILWVRTGKNAGQYVISDVISDNELHISETQPLNQTFVVSGTGEDFEVGSPSIGVARLYFLEPTMCEANQAARFTANTFEVFAPDYTIDTKYHELTSTSADGALDNTVKTLTSTSSDFETLGVKIGDIVKVTYRSLLGTVDVSAGIALSGHKLSLSIDDGPTQTMTFTGTGVIAADQDGTPGGIIQQITNAFADVTAVMSGNFLALHSSKKITMGTSEPTNTLLGFTAASDNKSSNAANFGSFVVKTVTSKTILVLDKLDGTAPTFVDEGSFKFELYLHGTQRLGPKDMAKNKEAGLYYMDVEIRSLVPGDGNNLADNTALTSTGLEVYGYTLKSNNDVKTLSTIEDSLLQVTPVILDTDLDDTLANTTTVAGKDIRVYYEKITTTGAAHAVLIADSHRVICNNPLARGTRPAYVYMDVAYSGGSGADVVKQDILDLINSAAPTVTIEAHDIYSILTKRGASSVTTPIEITAVRHNVDRTIDSIRSTDRLSVGRTTKLLATKDTITVTRT